MTKLLKILGLTGISSLTILNVLAQNCVSDFSAFQATNTNGTINWEQFGKIDLPFTLVYGGPTISGDFLQPLRHGFTHLSDNNSFRLISPSQRAILYYGVAYPNQDQPLELFRSPWNNDLNVYSNKWANDHAKFASEAAENTGKIEADIMLFDIERQWRTDFDILQLKRNQAIDPSFRNLSDPSFLSTYKKDLRAIYAKPLQQFKQMGYGATTKVSTYSDSPIWNTFDNIQGYTWQEWKVAKEPLNYLLQNDDGEVGGEFENELDFLAPSAYYYYDYPHPFAGEYLSYLLFQIEANKARSNKPIIPFVWMRYSFTPAYQNSFIKPWMAEATAIFPFFSGADGLWLWESPPNFQNDENLSTYEYFLKGLKRLSTYKYMFEGDHELVIAESARDLNESKMPIWRGVYKENKLLIAAHNPFAKDENELISVPISYQNYKGNIELKGHETSLCLIDLSILGMESEPSFSMVVYPNPSFGKLLVSFNAKKTSEVIFELYNNLGQQVKGGSIIPKSGENEFEIDLQNINSKVLNLRLVQDDMVLSKKLVLSK